MLWTVNNTEMYISKPINLRENGTNSRTGIFLVAAVYLCVWVKTWILSADFPSYPSSYPLIPKTMPKQFNSFQTTFKISSKNMPRRPTRYSRPHVQMKVAVLNREQIQTITQSEREPLKPRGPTRWVLRNSPLGDKRHKKIKF